MFKFVLKIRKKGNGKNKGLLSEINNNRNSNY